MNERRSVPAPRKTYIKARYEGKHLSPNSQLPALFEPALQLRRTMPSESAPPMHDQRPRGAYLMALSSSENL